ncbi:MAG: metallophosphoesterase [Clostridia bacterium]|nr:metallophosphoesterase [Clostridia bacterium]
MKKKTQKKRKKNGSFRALCFACIVFCIWLFSTFTLTTEEVVIKSNKIKNEITIVQISDLHGSVFGMNNSWITKKIDDAQPDFVVITGDMYTRESEDGRNTAVKLMKKISENHDVYFVNGEHDNDEGYYNELRENGVKYLDYKSEDITVGKTPLRLYGITNVYYSPTFDLNNEFTLDESKYNILLAHICNKEAFAGFGMDLCLCGDTHGGQVRLPVIGGLYGTTGWLPEIRDKNAFIKGLYEYENTSFFISSGLGNYPIPLRFMNRPEVVVIKLMPEIS